jgi:predicted amidophosphoribosyltransferase
MKVKVNEYWNESYNSDTGEEYCWKYLECSNCKTVVRFNDIICHHCGAELDFSDIDKEYWGDDE